MLGATMASDALPQLDGCVSDRRDPCASPPCKRLKQDGPPIECIVLEDSTEAPTSPSPSCQTGSLPPNQNDIDEKQALDSNKQTREQSVETMKSDVILMGTESTSKEDSEKENVLTDPALPFMAALSETKSDLKSSINGNLLNSSNGASSAGKCDGEPSAKLARRSPPNNAAKVKENGTLFRFLKPATSGSKTSAGDSKAPSKDDGKTPSENGDVVIVGSPSTPLNTKISPDGTSTVANVMTPSPGATPSLDTKTPTPRRKTPGRKLSLEEKLKREEEKLRKQKEKEALEQERLEKRKEKERVKEEKQKERMEAKQKKEQERHEQLEQKKQREKERNEKKEQEEKERKERLEKKEEEKRRKEEERKKKEDEKNLKNEEKRKKEAEEMLKKQKAVNSFASFFIKKENAAAPKTKEQTQKEAKFQPFELKQFMKLSSAPYRKPLSDNERQLLSTQLMKQTTSSLGQVKRELVAIGDLARVIKLEQNTSKPCCTKDDDEVMIIDDLKTAEMSSSEREGLKVKAKLLQFHQNYRPAYFGSWRKKSTRIGPRTPFKKDEGLLDYDVDSDDEWEEEEPGESLSNSEGEDEEEGCQNDDDDEQDGFFVPHGYLSDDEGDGNGEEDVMEHDGAENKLSKQNTEDKMERHLAKQKTWEAELKRQCKPMKRIAIGCIWDDGEIPTILRQLEACCLRAEGNIDPDYQEPVVATSPNTTAHSNTAVPEGAMGFLIKIIHGSETGVQKLARLFRKRWTLETKKGLEVNEENWESHCTVSKRQVEKKITSIASKQLRTSLPKARWYVHSNILAFYKMQDIPLPGNVLVASNRKEKSPSPVPLQAKSSIKTLFLNTLGSSEKANDLIGKGSSEKPSGVIVEISSKKPSYVTVNCSSEKPNGLIAELNSEKANGAIAERSSEKQDDVIAERNSEKANGVVAERIVEKPDDVIAEGNSEKANGALAKRSSGKPDEVVAERDSEKANSMTAERSSEKANGVTAERSSEKANGVTAEVNSQKLHSLITEKTKCEKSDVTPMDIAHPV